MKLYLVIHRDAFEDETTVHIFYYQDFALAKAKAIAEEYQHREEYQHSKWLYYAILDNKGSMVRVEENSVH